jgi:hypothetical protein
MPVFKYRKIEDMPSERWHEPSDRRIVNGLRLMTRLGTALATPLRIPKGVHKYRSIEELSADRDHWEQERVNRIRAPRGSKN